MELRSFVISQALRLEQSATDAARSILRLFNENSKTFGNKSSALSLKSKLDLLYDLEELTKDEYNHALKLLEIRNQFAHNPFAVSFESFDEINPDINKYLLKFEDEKSKAIEDREMKLRSIFSHLFMLVAGKLLVTEMDYREGMQIEMRRYINDHVVEELDEIWEGVLSKNNIKKDSETPGMFLFGKYKSQPDYLYRELRIAMAERATEKLDELEKNESLLKVFKQKDPVEERIKRRRKNKE